MFMLIFVSLLTIAFFVFTKYQNRRFNELANKIPGPPIVPILGNAHAISNHKKGMLDYMINSTKEYGTVVRHWIGSKFYVFLTDPNDIEILLKDTQNIRKSATYDFLQPWLGQGLVTSTGSHWHHHRKSLTPAFHFNILESFVEIFNEKGKVLIQKLNTYVGGEAFDIYPLITLYTLDAIMETSMGQKVNIQNEDESDYVTCLNRLQKIIHKRIYNPLIRSDFIFNRIKLGIEHKQLLDYIHGYCKEVISERRQKLEKFSVEDLEATNEIGKKKKFAFLDLLLLGQKAGNNLTDTDLLDEVNTFMFAGHDTTSGAITFAIHNLSKYPEIQQKVYEEIIDLFGDNENLTIHDLKKTVYLDMFIKETLRLSPPIPNISRLLDTDLKLTKYTIPAGTSTASFNYMVHRNKEHFPDPDKFDPERFSPENSKNRHPFAFVPFSAGLRNCIGQKYAMVEIKSTLIEVLRSYKICYAAEIPEVQFYIVLTPIGGVKVRLEKRSN